MILILCGDYYYGHLINVIVIPRSTGYSGRKFHYFYEVFGTAFYISLKAPYLYQLYITFNLKILI